MYDVIGDVHAYYVELHQLLTNMDYRYYPNDHLFVPPNGRKAALIGDYIDRGNYNRKVIELVRNMQREGLAHPIMGNHDFAAVQWVTPHPDKPNEFLRKHNEHNLKQHGKFLAEAEEDPDFYSSAIEWFKSLPLYLKLDSNHLVHACWYPPAIQILQNEGCMTAEGRLTNKGWLAAADCKSIHPVLIDLLIKGPENLLHSDHGYVDGEGIKRHHTRLAWWKENPTTMRDAYVSVPRDWTYAEAPYAPKKRNPYINDIRDQLKKLPQDERVFIGHIWETGEPAPLSDKVCCIDYSIARAGKLVAYRIQDGEREFNQNNFVWVNCMDRAAVRNNSSLIQPLKSETLSHS